MASVPWVQVQAAISTEKQHQISSKNAESKSTPELRDSVGLSAPDHKTCAIGSINSDENYDTVQESLHGCYKYVYSN
ncbi:hypothetical protein EB796_013474 [Bugula neritina]|uniref:Uncharacterized protein n=1 Tax=Bugula neritina TaxID=10212 RepID=A0A7J7JQI6_BUGNE|nr:hypothetical protein EB796_013474 [Bugula neritina]